VNSFRIVLAATVALGAAAFGMPAQALVKWNFVEANCVAGGCPSDDSSKTYDFYAPKSSEDGGTVTATGWANTIGSDTELEQGTVPDFGSSGIGVVNADHARNLDIESSSNGEHAVDNEDRFDLVLFQFEKSVSVSEVGIGWYTSDADISLLAWTGTDPGDTPALDNVLYTSTSEGLTGNGWELIGNFDVDSTDPDPDQGNGSGDFVQAVSTSVSSSYWIVAAYNPVFAGGPNEASACCEQDHLLDKFKILSLAGSITETPPGDPPSSVPEPMSMLLLAGGIVPMVWRRRRDWRVAA